MNPYLCKRKAFPSHKQHPLPSFDPRDAQHPLDGQGGTEMRVLITTPEMAIAHGPERYDGSRDLADALRHTIAQKTYSEPVPWGSTYG